MVLLLCCIILRIDAQRRKVIDIKQVAGKQWLIKIQFMPGILQRCRIAALSHRQPRRVGRQHIEQQEHKSNDTPQHQQAITYSFSEEADHF